MHKSLLLIGLTILCFSHCQSPQEEKEEEVAANDTSLVVTATAYNAIEKQTKKGRPDIGAWGDTLRPGVKAIAVSRDLLKEGGLKHNDTVYIEGLKGPYRVMDKMNKRWKKKIDIFMGLDEKKAINWGKQEVTLTWEND